MKFNCIAVDHDVNALKILSTYISSLPDYKLIKTFTDPIKALHAIRSNSDIDILFMDIEISMMNGIELSKAVKQKTKKLIFTSAHSQYALDAFELEGDDFLLKPYSFSKFVHILDRLFINGLNVQKETKSNDDFFFIKSKQEKFKLVKIRYQDIITVESLQNYISIYTTTKTIVAHLTLTKIKEILKDQEQIIQVHRSFIISKYFIEEIENNMIIMENDLRITMGENYKDEVLLYIKGRTIKTGRA